MAKVKIKNEKSLKETKEKLRGIVDFRKTKSGVVMAKAKWLKKRKKEK